MRRRDVLAGLPFLASAAPIWAQTTKTSHGPKRRAALCIGVSHYAHHPDLPSAVPDATLIGAGFANLGFRVTTLHNPTHHDLLLALAKFRLSAQGAELATIYVAAHGFMQDAQNHILCQDSRTQAVPEAVLLQAISDIPRQKGLFLDCCREDPTHFQTAQTRPTADSPYRAGVHVSYATQPQAPAFDGQTGHSPYANALNAALTIPGLELTEMTRHIRLKVLQMTSGVQIPWDKSSLLSSVIFHHSAG